MANEVAFEYGPWVAVAKSTQNHATGTASTDPNVQYAYDDGSGGADLDANYVRPASVTYPGPSTRRVVYYNYASTGVGAPMSRLENIASAGSPSASQKYASYMYLEAGTVVKVSYPGVTNDIYSLALTYGGEAFGDYPGFDGTTDLSATPHSRTRTLAGRPLVVTRHHRAGLPVLRSISLCMSAMADRHYPGGAAGPRRSWPGGTSLP